MELSIQSVLLNVTDLDRSIDFYRDVFELQVVSQADRVAMLIVSDQDRQQVLVLRQVGSNVIHGGRGTIGPRLVAFEGGSSDELATIEQRLSQRNAFVERIRTATYEGIIGVDPDRIEVSIATSTTGVPIRTEDWATIDDAIYGIE